ncbi:MAG: HEAT repeat domain-containing protein [Micropruina sp.]|nr:HEAT repeat domain-containing protein [Micropruina sp.]
MEEIWLRIGEVARRTGLTVRTLRHYDELGLLTPSDRTSGHYRLYSPEDLRRLLNIQQLKSLGLSLFDVARALDDPAFDASGVLHQHMALVRERVQAEQELLARLSELQSADDSSWSGVLAIIALTERLRHPDPTIRLRAALSDPTTAPLATLIQGLVDDPDDAVREVLTWAVVQRGEMVVPLVAAHLSHADPAVRRQMAHVLSKLGDRAAVGPLIRLLADEDATVVAKAIFALGQLGGAEALKALLDHLGDADPVRRDTLTRALASFGVEAAVPLANLVDGSRAPGQLPRIEVRLHAVETLGFLGEATAVPALIRALDDTDADVRFGALVALGQHQGSEIGASLEGALDSPEERIRLLARRLLADRAG